MEESMELPAIVIEWILLWLKDIIFCFHEWSIVLYFVCRKRLFSKSRRADDTIIEGNLMSDTAHPKTCWRQKGVKFEKGCETGLSLDFFHSLPLLFPIATFVNILILAPRNHLATYMTSAVHAPSVSTSSASTADSSSCSSPYGDGPLVPPDLLESLIKHSLFQRTNDQSFIYQVANKMSMRIFQPKDIIIR